MADLSITTASVVKQAGAQVQTLNAATGVTITAGETIYADTTVNPNVWRLSNGTTSAATGSVTAIALNGAGPGQPCQGLTSGPITIGATTVVGQIYVQSVNNGAIAPVSDLTTGTYTVIIGYGIASNGIQVGIINTGVVHG